MDDIPPLLVARLLDLAEVEAVVEMALGGRVALVPLEDPPLSDGRHAMVIHAPGLREPLVLSAVPAGEETAGLYPLRVQPIDDKQAATLRAFRVERRSSQAPPKSSKPSSNRSRFPREERTLPDARADPLLGFPLANGKYEIETALGDGAYGRVYRARHRTLNKSVAIKVLQGLMERDAEFAARFQREALAASKLDHPNVAQVLDFGEEPDGMLYIVMELLTGQNLRDVLNAERPLPLHRIAEIMSQVCAALSAAHDAGVVHRDVKPENVVMVQKRNDDGEMAEVVKLCDFGIATMQSRGGSDGSGRYLSTGGSTVAGTPEYMSPEQARGEKVDARTDIYSCGVLLYEMACGEVPFSGTSPVAILVAHASDEPRVPSDIDARVDKRLEQVILKALAKQPSQRQQSARELRADLRRILSNSGETRAVGVTRKSAFPPPLPREETNLLPVDPRMTPTLPAAGLDVREVAPTIPDGDEPRAAVVIDANQTPEVKTTPPPQPDPGPPPPPITDPQMGFAEFLSAVTSAVARTTYYERAHPEFARSLAQLVSVMVKPLERRGEITLARRDAQTNELAVMTGSGETAELAKAAPGGVGASCAQRLAEVFARRGLVSLTFKEGLGEKELGDAIELLSGPEISSKELQDKFVARGLTKVSILFATEMLGRDRRLPWQVMLCISRVARDIAAVPKIAREDPDRRKRLRMALIADVTRTLKAPELVKMLLTSWNLIADTVGESEELRSVDIPAALVASLAHPMLLGVASLILAEMEKGAVEPQTGASAVPPSGTSVRQLMYVIGNRFVRERTIESDEVLRALHSRAVLSFPELPEDLQVWVLAEQQAEQLAKDPEQVLRVLDSVFEVPRYAREVSTLGRAMRVLARRGEVESLWTIIVRLQQRHARGALPGDETREGLAARTIASLADADVLAPIAAALLSGPGTTKDAAQGILVTFGEAGAQALCAMRIAGGDMVRIRFVEALREIGRASTGPLTGMLERLMGTPGGEEDVGLADDVLRALPEIQNERLGLLVAGLLRHKAPSVRRSAATALAAPWGAQARSVLIGAVDDPDEGVRVAALTGLRKVGAVDLDMVRRVERILGGPATAGDNACAVAAALLTDVVPDARDEAITVLCNAIQPRARGVVALLTRAPRASQETSLVVETIARVLLTIGGSRGRDAVEKRLSKSSGPIKARLSAMLQNG